jgi:hypothetical protein
MWRYKLVPVRLPSRPDSHVEPLEAELNGLGSEGWEAVAVMQQIDGWCWVLFKMPHEVGTY